MKLENFKLMVKLKLKEMHSKNEKKLNQLNRMIQTTEEMINEVKEFDYNSYQMNERQMEAKDELKKSREKLIRIKDITEDSMKIEVECPNCKRTIVATSFYIEGKFKYINEKVVCVSCMEDEIRQNNWISFKKEENV
ncbi:MAG: hypothetical protein ACRCW9_06205 [Cetobacterium sp.]